MSVLAFIYQKYDNYSMRDYCRGRYDDTNQALELLRGDRYEYCYMDLLDLDTLGWETYEWQLVYDHKEEDGKQYLKLKYKNGGAAPEPEWFEAEMWCEDQLSTESKAKFDAGNWVRQR